MSYFKLNSSFNTQVAFHVPGQPDSMETGTLDSKNGKLTLTSSPQYSKTDERSMFELMAGRSGSQDFVEALVGRTTDEPCSLLYSQYIDSPGVLDFRTSERLDSRRYRTNLAVLGLALEGANSNEIQYGSYSFSSLQGWMPSAWLPRFTEQGTQYEAAPRPTTNIWFSSLELQAEIRCELLGLGSSARNKGTFLKTVPVIVVTPRTPRSVEWFYELLPRIENFFSLMLGTSVRARALRVAREKSEGWVIAKRRSKKQKPNLQLWIKCDAHIVARALAAWLAVSESERDIERVLLGAVRNSNLFVETEFLSLAQAAEAFGRLKFNVFLADKSFFKKSLKSIGETISAVFGDSPVAERCRQLLAHANEPSFAYRLERTLDILGPELSERICGERDVFIRSVVHTRNYFTHLATTPGKWTVKDANPLFRLNQKLHAMLRAALLLDSGVPLGNVREPAIYQATRYS